MSTYLRIAGEISRATLLADGEEPTFWEVNADDYFQFMAEIEPGVPAVFGVPIIMKSDRAEGMEESDHSRLRQVSKGSGLNEDRRHDASAADEQVANDGAPTTEPISAE